MPGGDSAGLSNPGATAGPGSIAQASAPAASGTPAGSTQGGNASGSPFAAANTPGGMATTSPIATTGYTPSAGQGGTAAAVPATGCPGTLSPPSNASSLNTRAATYLGMGAQDEANAVEIDTNCSLLVGGRFTGTDFARTAVDLIGGGTGGAVLRLNASGTTVLAVIRVGGLVSDLALRRANGDMAIASDAGVVVAGADGKTVRWKHTSGGAAQRVAIAEDGHAAALFGKTLRVFDPQGQLKFERAFGDSAVNDVAIDSASGLVFVTGFAQRNGAPCSQLQVAWIRSYTLAGAAAWKAWDWSKDEAGAGSNCADTRGLRVAMGRDGKLYFAGESAGGNTIYRWLPTDLSKPAPNVANDSYNTEYNTASNHITYFARLNPATGTPEKGQLLLTRLGSGKGNSIFPRGLAADEAGNVYVAGNAAYAIANRTSLSINGKTLAAYAGGDPFVLVVSPDFATRRLWITPADGGNGDGRAVAASGGVAALASVGRLLPFALHNSLQSLTGGGGAAGTSTGHLMVWDGFAK
ncbi:SBBP repeat-containing protein [Noviherbaspirillum humi]|uniref:SBBP repeat-containing protein n=1 Tax=Noviherbaspirillum humi TaxID=1688639 RepID=UPI00116060A9|nr:SBBP repeat-containing protein [Noviherbaspirillum humi]